MRQKSWRSAWWILPLLAWLPACHRAGSDVPVVVLYSSIDEPYTRQVTRAFEKETGMRVDVVTDSEAAKSTGLLQRLLAEKNRPVADVFWSGDVMRALRLRQAGLAEGLPGETGAVPGFDLAWGFSAGPGRLRLIVFNTRQMQREQVPQRVEDLAGLGVANRACFANPLFGSTSMHAGLLLQLWGREKAEKFFRDFTANGGRILASNGEVKRRVADGEFAFGLTDSDDVAVAIADEKGVGFVVPDQGAGDSGAVLIPSAAVVLRSAPHREAGERLARFISRKDIQGTLRDGVAAFFPLSPDAADKSADLWKFDLGSLKLAPRMDEPTVTAFEKWTETFLEPWLQDQQR